MSVSDCFWRSWLTARCRRPLRYLLRTAYFFPVLVGLVYCSIIWQFLYQKDTGIFNYYLGLLGVAPIPWLSGRQWIMPSIILMDVWKNAGFAMLVFLAGLQNISQSYYEAAADRWSQSLATVPAYYAAADQPNSVLQRDHLHDRRAAGLRFDPGADSGGPGDASRSLVMYIYENAFQLFQMGYASAVSITLFIIIMILTLIQFRVSQSWVHYE